ncbi:Gp37-like protein [Halalkalibacterium halodurans]|uniref:Gp37-like protein n=1 Tax=Halalkalibacterium halodurans TaxID=86665 RepID=UPI002E1F8BC5|nr:tail fiber domain-containing protein [Halalkalibacterium halodurans]
MQPIRVYTSGINLLAEVDTYQSLQFERSYFGYGKFELHINRYMHEAEAFNKSNIILLNKQGNKAGIIIGKEIALDEAGKETENFKLTGYALDGLVSRRVTVPPEGDSHDRVSGSAEAVMKHYIRRHFVDPADSKRRMPNLVIAPNQNRGPHIHWESRFKNVADELEAIGMRTGVGWGVWLDVVNRQFVFDVIHARDLTQDNAQGYSPVFFSPDFNTIRSQQFVDSDNEYRNFGYVGGQGEGEERKIVTVGEGDVGINRIETFIDARDLGEDEDGDLTNEEIEKLLKERGEQKLREMRRLLSFEAEILTPVQGEAPFEYEKDYDLGDRVDVVNKSWRIIMSAPIVAFNEVHEPGGFRLEATFGEEQPTILTKIKRKFDELTGAEVQEIPSMIAIKEMEQAKRYADQQDIIYDGIAKEDASEKANRAEQNAKDYTLIVADNIEYRTQQFTEQYAQKRISQGYVPPNNPSIGDLWIDITPEPHMWRRWNGAEWEALERTDLSQLQGQIDSGQLADGAVVSDKIAANAVVAGKIATGTITSDLISTAGLDAGVIKFGTMSGERIQAGTITANQLGANSVTAAKIATNAVTASKISVNSLSAVSANLGNITAGNITGVNITGATINGGTITQTSADGSVKLDNTGLTVSSNSGAKILMNISNLGGNHGDDLSLTFIDQFGNVGMSIYDYYVDSVIRSSRRLNLEGGDLGITIDGRANTMPGPGTMVLGGMSVSGDLSLEPSGVTGGIHLRSHIIGVQNLSNAEHLTVYPNRAQGVFKVRSHHNRSSYRDDFYISEDGIPYFLHVWDNTSSNAANVRIGASGQLLRSSSSLRYKRDIEDLDEQLADNVVENLRPVWFRSKSENDNSRWSYVGLLAEEVHEVEPRLVDYKTTDDNGVELAEPVPEGVAYDRIAVYLLPVVKNLRKQMSDVLDELNWLKIENQYLIQKVKQLEGDPSESTGD